ncbi:MAG: ribonuclease E/G, partial [Aeromicrobium sp.]
MLDDNDTPTAESTEAPTTRRRAAGRPAGPPAAVSFAAPVAPATAPRAKAEPKQAEPQQADRPLADDTSAAEDAPVRKAPARRATRKAAAPAGPPADVAPATDEVDEDEVDDIAATTTTATSAAPTFATAAMFKAPEPGLAPARTKPAPVDTEQADVDDDADEDDDDPDAPRRRRRSRGGRRRRKGEGDSDDTAADSDDDTEDDGNGGTRRRRRRARAGEGADAHPDDPENTVVRVRNGRTAEDEITGVAGSTRLEAKKQRRREGREAGRRRAPIVSEAEFLARRESVKREMVVRQRDDYTQIAVIEDNVLVEHYVARESQTSLIGNVYLGKVQNVLPSMEAAFVDIGAGRNAVLYAGEVDWTTLGNGKQRKIEDALTPG